jgi:hypothetical protein
MKVKTVIIIATIVTTSVFSMNCSDKTVKKIDPDRPQMVVKGTDPLSSDDIHISGSMKKVPKE